MKKISVYFSCVLGILAVSILCAACSESVKVTGTSEETNEFAFYVSSCDEAVSSSGNGVSSSEILSSSGNVVSSSAEIVSSNSNEVSSSSEKSFSNPEEFSSSSESWGSSSSYKPPPQGGKNPTSSSTADLFDRYIAAIGLNVDQVYAGAMAVKSEKENEPNSNPGQAMVTEFDGPWPHVFVKQNIDALSYFFPEAAKKYAGLIAEIKKDSVNDGCKLYMMNVSGNENSIGFAIVDIAADAVTVLNVVKGDCTNTTENKTFRFLFRYCGDIISRPEIKYVEVENNISQDECPNFKDNGEWVN